MMAIPIKSTTLSVLDHVGVFRVPHLAVCVRDIYANNFLIECNNQDLVIKVEEEYLKNGSNLSLFAIPVQQLLYSVRISVNVGLTSSHPEPVTLARKRAGSRRDTPDAAARKCRAILQPGSGRR